jgi:uncharacterized protein with GYD domain
MPTYIALANWTDQGIRNVRETIERAEKATELAQQKYGVRLAPLYWTEGPYDLVAVLEAPDEQSAQAFALELGSLGSVRSTTLRAYNSEEMSQIIERLGPAPGT